MNYVAKRNKQLLLNYLNKAIKLDKASVLYFDKNKESNKIAVAKEEGLIEGLEKGKAEGLAEGEYKKAMLCDSS